MTDLRKAAEQALEALANCNSEHGHRCNRCDSEVDEGGKVAGVLRAALAAEQAPDAEALRAEVEELRRDLAENEALRERMADLLRRTAAALRGPEPPLTLWSWHDLPERAAAAAAAAKKDQP